MGELLEDYALNKSLKNDTGNIKAGIVGCGSVGQELAILISKSGIDLVFVEVSEEKVQEAIDAIGTQIDNIISHWGMTSGDKRAIMSRIEGSTDYKSLADCNVVIESVSTARWVPNMVVRKEILSMIEEVVSDNCMIVSNTSTVAVSDLASDLKIPGRIIGMHFISPVLQNKIVELDHSISTSEEALLFAQRFAKMVDKEIVNVYSSPGNISARIIVPMINEACELLMEGVSTVAEIDQTMKMGYGLLRGPFAMADRIGLDKLSNWMEGLYEEYGDPKYKTSPIIQRMVRSGLTGLRVGEGFYIYKDGKRINKQGSILTLGK